MAYTEGWSALPTTLLNIKSKLDNCIGASLTVTSHVGRKKVTKRHGILRETFPAVFIVELSHKENAVERVSYSYTDVLTNNIILDFDQA